MARKSAPKEKPPETPAEEPVVIEPTPENKEKVMVKAEPVDKSRVPFESHLEAMNYIEECLKGTMDEITRCNEYIFAKADSYRRFQTYKDELYLYRYKVHQLRFHPNFPHIRPCDFPERPEKIKDQ